MPSDECGTLPELQMKIRNTVISREDENVFSDRLSKAKEKIAEFKIRYGENSWRLAVDSNAVSTPAYNFLQPPATRGAIKLVEIAKTCQLRVPEDIFMLCEAPGGWLQAASELWPDARKETCSLTSDTALKYAAAVYELPNLKMRRLGDGDIRKTSVRESLQKLGKYDLITADGASNNEQRHDLLEAYAAHLFACEVKCAFLMQSEGGTFVCKFFGGNLLITRQILMLLTHAYNDVDIVNPHTSRAVNDERYVVCRGFVSERAPSFELPDVKENGFLVSMQIPSCPKSNHIQTVLQKFVSMQTHAIEQTLLFSKRLKR